MKLLISARSPFARRVRLALLESGIEFEAQIFDVFKPTAELLAKNPLARVPTLVTKDGQAIIESSLILNFLEKTESKLSTLFKRSNKSQFWNLSGICVGLMEKAVEFYLEKMRPDSHQDQEVLSEINRAVELSLPMLAQAVTQKEGAYLFGDDLSQADIDLSVALTYLGLRHSKNWQTQFPVLKQYADQLESRPHFQQTSPPP